MRLRKWSMVLVVVTLLVPSIGRAESYGPPYERADAYENCPTLPLHYRCEDTASADRITGGLSASVLLRSRLDGYAPAPLVSGSADAVLGLSRALTSSAPAVRVTVTATVHEAIARVATRPTTGFPSSGFADVWLFVSAGPARCDYYCQSMSEDPSVVSRGGNGVTSISGTTIDKSVTVWSCAGDFSAGEVFTASSSLSIYAGLGVTGIGEVEASANLTVTSITIESVPRPAQDDCYPPPEEV